MVNFIKPNFLGTERDFKESYAGPIEAGQHRDSSRLEVRVMKERSFILHKKLSKFVQVGYSSSGSMFILIWNPFHILTNFPATRCGNSEEILAAKIRIRHLRSDVTDSSKYYVYEIFNLTT